MSELNSLENKIERDKIIKGCFDEEFRVTAGRMYSQLIELHLNELDARQWFYTPNIYLDNKSPHNCCLNGRKSTVLKVAKDEIDRMEWGINS